MVEKLEPDWLENVRIDEPGGRQGSLFNYRLQATQVTKHKTSKLQKCPHDDKDYRTQFKRLWKAFNPLKIIENPSQEPPVMIQIFLYVR